MHNLSKRLHPDQPHAVVCDGVGLPHEQRVVVLFLSVADLAERDAADVAQDFVRPQHAVVEQDRLIDVPRLATRHERPHIVFFVVNPQSTHPSSQTFIRHGGLNDELGLDVGELMS